MKNNSFEEDAQHGEKAENDSNDDFLVKRKPSRKDYLSTPNNKKNEGFETIAPEADKDKNEQLLEFDIGEPKKLGKMPKFTGRPVRQKKVEATTEAPEEFEKDKGNEEAEIRLPPAKPKPNDLPPKQSKSEQQNQVSINEDGNEDGQTPEVSFNDPTDRPLKSAGTTGQYNLDKIEELEKMYKPSAKALAKNAPKTATKELPVELDKASFAKEKPANPDNIVDDIVISEAKPKNVKPPVKAKAETGDNKVADQGVLETKLKDEAPIRPLTNNYTSNADNERPLKSKPGPKDGNDIDNRDEIKETPVPSQKARSKEPPVEQPIAPKKVSADEERPLGGKGPDTGYNLDNIEELEKAYKPSNKALAARNKPPGNTKAPEKIESQPEQPTSQPIKAEKPLRPAPENQTIEPKDIDEAPIGGGNKANNPFNEANAYPPDQGQPDDGGVDADATLEGRMRSPNFATKVKAFEDVLTWTDETVTPELVCKGLHLTIKEKHPQVIDKILSIIENIIENHKAAWQVVDFKKFLTNFGEHLMSNVKGASKDHSTAIIPTLWAASKKEEFLATLKEEMLKKSKVKLQENALTIVLELVKVGKVEELGYFKPIKEELESLITSRSVSLKNLTMAIYKEAYLWLGDAIKAFTGGIKEAQMKELDAYFKTVDKSQMKIIEKKDGTGKAKALDVYDMVTEAELPPKFNQDAWVDEVLACAKWNERKEKIDELNNILVKTPKLSPKTNIFNFLNLARRIFMDTNVVVQVTIIKTLGLLAASLRKHFVVVSKTMFPTLLGKLKEKNRSLSEEIISTLEKFYCSLTFEETHDDFKEHLKDKNTDKKLNLLKVLILLVEKLDKIKTDKAAVSLVKLVISLLDENDASVRDSASQLIAKVMDNFNDKITPLLSDLNSQKKSKILNFCQNSSMVAVTPSTNDKKPAESKDKVENEPAMTASTRKLPSSMSKDKSQMIAEMREKLFSNQTVKLSDTKNFSNFLYTNLKSLIELTKEFKEVSTTQCKEILLLIQEIAVKVDKNAFPEDSRKIIIQFYIEQLLCKNSDEIFESMEQLVYHQSKIVSAKIFLTDMFDVIARKSVKVSRELLVAILKIIDKEVANNSQLSLIPHKQFVDFLKSNFSGQSIHQTYKAPLLNAIRNYGKKFGDKSLNDFPTSLIKELESQNTEAQKAFSKTFEKMNDKNPEKKKAALIEIANFDDSSKIILFWNNTDFMTFLKRMLIMETRSPNYGVLLTILSRYLEIYKENPNDFSMKNYLFVFQAVLTHYYDRKDNDRFNQEVEALVQNSVKTITATTIINEFIGDTNAVAWKEQILHFYFQFFLEIDTSVKFVNYLISLVGQKGPANEIRPLIESVLLLLKGTSNDELILKGNENKYIREVWQKNEEDLLINENFIKGTKVFEDSGAFQVIKNFICEALKIEENNFFTKIIEPYAFSESDNSPKIKLAFYYMRSVENLPRTNEFFIRQLSLMDLSCLDNVSLFVSLRIVFQVLKNIFYMQGEELFLRSRELFINILHRLPLTFEEFFKIADFANHEISFFNVLLNNEEFGLPEMETPTPMKPTGRNVQGKDTSDVNITSANMGLRDPTIRGDAKDRRQPTQLGGAIKDTDDVPLPGRQARENQAPSSPRSGISPYKKANNAKQLKLNNLQDDNISANNLNPPIESAPFVHPQQPMLVTGDELENPMLLQEKFQKMLTFDLGEFEDASDYFKALCRSQNPNSLNFLKIHANDIVKVFVEVCATVFNEGINYDLERSSYELIFVPFQQLCALDEFLLALQQPILNVLVEHVLMRLVLSNEEKTVLEQSNEDQAKLELAGLMVKFWNSIMLRVIENAECNSLLTALFIILINYREFENDHNHQLIYNLASKCIIRITRNLKNIINKIDPRVVLNLIYNYIQAYGVRNADNLGFKSIRSLLNQLVVRSDPDFIWTCYYEIFGDQGEPYINKLIRSALASGTKEGGRGNTGQDLEQDLYSIIQEINKQTRIAQIAIFINDIKRILEEEPSLDIRNFESAFANKSYFEYVIRELRVNKASVPGLNNTASKQISMQGLNNNGFTGSSNYSNQKQAMPQAPAKGGNVPSTKKSPVNVKKTKNIDDFLNKSDLDTSEMYRRMDERSRYNYN